MSTMSVGKARSQAAARSGARALHEAVAMIFALDRDGMIDRLSRFGETDWRSALEWLDVSGMALYVLDHVWAVGANCVLPAATEEAFACRLRRNRERMTMLLQETLALTGWFECAGIPYALLKGMSLAPESVPDIALRSQVDLDFLVEAKHRALAAHYVRRLGYRVHAETRTVIEFRAPGTEPPNLASLYSECAVRALELHFTSEAEGRSCLLARRVRRWIHDMPVYALSPADVLVQQARHLLKHLCGEYTRLSWVLEFRRHVITRQYDPRFWDEVAEIAREHENADLAMAISFWLAGNIFGALEVEPSPQWTPRVMPAPVRLWLECYARQLLLSNPRPTKIYALLRKEIPSTSEERRPTRAILFPRYLPARVMDRRPGESPVEGLRRFGTEARFFLRRLRFHLVEGLRFGIEASRFKRAVARAEQ